MVRCEKITDTKTIETVVRFETMTTTKSIKTMEVLMDRFETIAKQQLLKQWSKQESATIH